MSSTTISTVVGAALGALVLTSCGSTQASDVSQGRADTGRISKEAVVYAGDPWEKRIQKAFWSGHHVHDSWNRCHVGENSDSGAGHVGPFESLQEAQAC